MFKKLICKIFGHSQFKGPLLVLKNHATLKVEELTFTVPTICSRCGKDFKEERV